MKQNQPYTSLVTGITYVFKKCRSHAAIRCVNLTVALALSLGTAQAQGELSSGSQRASRASLTARVSQLETETSGTKLTGDARNKALSELATIRDRLTQGDFRVGDRFVITIRRDSVRSDTASVRDSLNVTIANLPDVSLIGVLRSELDDKLSKHVATYLLNTTVRTTLLTRVAILGAVQRPGFYYALPDRAVSDLVMIAGGPATDANLNELEISRSRTQLVSAKDSRRAIKEGRTLEQLDVRSGDEVTIPAKRKVNWQLVIQLLFIVSSLFFAVIQFLQYYYRQKAGN
jgi:protein involved in polysaccharide export with SLBB domain